MKYSKKILTVVIVLMIALFGAGCGDTSAENDALNTNSVEENGSEKSIGGDAIGDEESYTEQSDDMTDHLNGMEAALPSFEEAFADKPESDDGYAPVSEEMVIYPRSEDVPPVEVGNYYRIEIDHTSPYERGQYKEYTDPDTGIVHYEAAQIPMMVYYYAADNDDIDSELDASDKAVVYGKIVWRNWSGFFVYVVRAEY